MNSSNTTFNDFNNTIQNKSTPSMSGFLIGVEVLTAVIVVFTLAFCYIRHFYLTKQRNKRNEKMIEAAIYYQESRFLYHLEGECHSTSTIATRSLLVDVVPPPPPPSYYPPDTKKQLPTDVVARLDYLLSQNQYCTTTTISSPQSMQHITLPKYTDNENTHHCK